MKPKKNEQHFFVALQQELTKKNQLLYVGQLLKRAADKFGDTIALIYEDKKLSYQEFYHRAMALTKFLKQKGVQPRDRVIICLENSPDFFIAYYGALQAGAIVAPVNTFLKEYELDYIIKDAQPRVIITNPDRMNMFKKTLNEFRSSLLVSSADFPQPDMLSVPDKPIDLQEDEPAALLYTSGTTGFPKGVMLCSRNIMTNIMQGISRFQLGFGERIFGVLPLFHVFSQCVCVWIAIFLGATVILVAKVDRRYILSALKHAPTGFIGIPALYGLLCLLKTAPLHSVKYFVSGGDALPDKIRSYFALLYRRKICNGYGLTETSPLIAVDFDDVAQPTNTVGKPVIGVSIEVRDEQGKPVTNGVIGELWVKGDNIMLGYYNAPEETEHVLQDGWFKTGDTMYVDAHGKLVVAGRVKDLIIHKGINIYPQEIENVIMSYPNVVRVAVIGIKDDTYGEVPIAYVQLRQKEDTIEQKLKALCDQQLASYKVPRQFICSSDELPITATGKIDKKTLRKMISQE